MNIKAFLTCLLSVLFSSSVLAMGRTEVNKLNAVLQDKERIIYDESRSHEDRQTAVKDAQGIVQKFIGGASSGRTAGHIFTIIRFGSITIAESTQSEILKELNAIMAILQNKENELTIQTDSHEEEVEELSNIIAAMEIDQQRLVEALRNFLERQNQ